ncbi:MAG: hypothetical protein ACK421_07670 [Pseudanabaenaceae cyanobacterium]
MDKKLALRVLDVIKKNRKNFDQREWHCGTVHCFAGILHLTVLGLNLNEYYGEDEDKTLPYSFIEGVHTREFARKRLGLTEEEADRLFDQENSLDEIEKIIEEIGGC